jgi:hypothetical protein
MRPRARDQYAALLPAMEFTSTGVVYGVVDPAVADSPVARRVGVI